MKRSVQCLMYCLGTFWTVSCIGISEAVFSVEGEFRDANDVPFDNCVLQVYLAEQQLLIYTRKVGSVFSADFTARPHEERYFLRPRAKQR